MPASTSARMWRTIGRYVGGAVLVVALLAGGLTARIFQFSSGPATLADADAIVVLGAAQYNGRPSAVFRERLDHAADLYRRGLAGHVITTGGGKPGDATTEGEAGARYLVGVGLPEGAVQAVPTGIDTLISLRAAADVAQQHGWDSVILVTDPWHMARSRAMARDLGWQVQTSPVTEGPATDEGVRAKYVLRELAGIVFYRLVGGSSGSGSAVL